MVHQTWHCVQFCSCHPKKGIEGLEKSETQKGLSRLQNNYQIKKIKDRTLQIEKKYKKAVETWEWCKKVGRNYQYLNFCFLIKE